LSQRSDETEHVRLLHGNRREDVLPVDLAGVSSLDRDVTGDIEGCAGRECHVGRGVPPRGQREKRDDEQNDDERTRSALSRWRRTADLLDLDRACDVRHRKDAEHLAELFDDGAARRCLQRGRRFGDLGVGRKHGQGLAGDHHFAHAGGHPLLGRHLRGLAQRDHPDETPELLHGIRRVAAHMRDLVDERHDRHVRVDRVRLRRHEIPHAQAAQRLTEQRVRELGLPGLQDEPTDDRQP
jgi:hypothetical protein